MSIYNILLKIMLQNNSYCPYFSNLAGSFSKAPKKLPLNNLTNKNGEMWIITVCIHTS